MIIYLYKKTHLVSGINYLGVTSKNPYKYKGSGVIWNKHLKNYGNHTHTIILRECHNMSEAKKWGLYYSELWNIVSDDNWANLIPEYVGGVRKSTNEPKAKSKIKVKDKLNATKAEQIIWIVPQHTKPKNKDKQVFNLQLTDNQKKIN